jgi:hypothetical protein
MSVVSASDVWTVGNYVIGNTGSPSLTLTEHWDGTSWSVVPSPNVGTSGNRLSGVSAIAPNDVWAVGSSSNNDLVGHTLIEHGHDKHWRVVASPNVGTANNELNGVAVAPGTQNLWAVGYSSLPFQSLIEFYS